MTARRADLDLRLRNRDAGARDPGMPAFNPALAVYLRRQLVQAVETYCRNGRKFAKLDGEALQERFISAFDAWVSGQPDAALALNDAAAEYLLRRRPAPIEQIAGQLGLLLQGSGRATAASLDREPVVVVSLGRLLFAPFMGSLSVANGEPDDAALARDFDAIMAAIAPRRVR
jgi:hypothetical protein